MDVEQVTDQELRNHAEIDPEHQGEWSVPRTFHWTSAESMYQIDKLWYNAES